MRTISERLTIGATDTIKLMNYLKNRMSFVADITNKDSGVWVTNSFNEQLIREFLFYKNTTYLYLLAGTKNIEIEKS